MKAIKLLLVEDSADDAEMLLYELRRAGYSVEYERVETADEMVAALHRQAWDIVIADYSLPRFSGEAALQIVQESGVDLPFIMVSGAIGEERAVEVMRAGAHDYVMKGNLKRLSVAIQRELREVKERQARRTAEEQVVKLSRALEQSASLVIITNTNGIIEYVNHAFTEVTGYQPDEVIGQHSRLLQSGLTSSQTYKRMWNTIMQGETWRGEFQNRKKSGELFWVETIISAIKNPAGEITQFLSVQEDATHRKRLEAELRQYTDQLELMVDERTRALRVAKEEIELILNNTEDAIALVRPNGDMRAYNAMFMKFFGAQVDQNVERLLWTLSEEAQVSAVSEALMNAIRNKQSQRVEAQVIMANGTPCDVQLAFIPVQAMEDNQPDVDGFLICAHDITSLKEMERLKTRFVADAVHDLATPIAGLTTRLYMLKKSPQQVNEHVNALENQVAHLRDLLGDLRTLSQLDRGQFSLELARLNLNTLVRRVFDTYEPVAIEKGQSLKIKTASHLPDIRFDRRRIERALVNLIANAINYTPHGKSIEIRTDTDGKDVVFSVTDEGIGIHPGDRDRIFERFYRTDSAREMQSNGTGLGLAITREIVEMHGGSVIVESEPGYGSTFTLRLPITRHD